MWCMAWSAHKTHAKMLMVVRREDGKLRRYVHLGTGNYHPRTARLYTDFGLFTCNEEICADVNEVFIQLTGLGKASKLHHLWQSPFTLHTEVLARHPERNQPGQGGQARAHHRQDECAAGAGDHHGAVRGLASGREGRPDRARRMRIAPRRAGPVGEHPGALDHRPFSRTHAHLLLPQRSGSMTCILSSADWMDRNFFRRIEVCFPVLDEKLKKRVIDEGLKIYLQDNCQAWDMDGEGHYRRKRPRRATREVRPGRIAQAARQFPPGRGGASSKFNQLLAALSSDVRSGFSPDCPTTASICCRFNSPKLSSRRATPRFSSHAARPSGRFP